MAPKRSKFAEQLFAAHLNQLERLVAKRGVKGLVPLYKAARGDLHDRLRSVGKGKDKATPTTLRALASQAEGALSAFGVDLQRHLSDTGRAASELGGRHMVDEYEKLEEHFAGTTPVLDLDRAAVFKGMIDDVEPSLLRRHRLLSQRWSLGAIQSMEDRLAIGAMAGKSLDEMVSDVMSAGGVVEQERWRAERIVRTETAYAHGATKFEAMKRTAAELGEEGRLQKRLISTFDDRTGDDSFLLHGQTVPVDEPFKWKHKVGGVWVVTEYMHPPNRPNDREVVIPWDPSWEETEEERPLTKGELASAEPTRWRKTPGVEIPPGHKPGKAYK